MGYGIMGGDKPAQPAEVAAEHMPLTYTLSKNEATGSVTIHYSEPTGFPFHFHWETTVALDGTSTTTPITVEA